ncbi:MAG: asparagine synthase (glutamine-hydrolyzing) [Candidatus Saccharibacteria bacterium]|nr:asparagine synthase (glutamine-hydrolyzing) [Candidatus Saccharibacteria bacterium]
MCGIAGCFAFDNTKEILTKMSDAMTHRGPDGSGETSYSENGIKIGLAHRRLAIIDRAAGKQPMKSVNNPKYEIVYNGEVYNYVELREELLKENPKLKFSTNSDTEVVLEAYIQWGSKAFDKFNGMFGLAILNREKDEVVLARDHFGIKPVYYYEKDGKVLFASEIKTMLASGVVETEPNDKIVYRYLKFRVQDDTNETFFANIYRLMPGEMMTINKNGSKRKMYTKLREELVELAKNPKKYSPEVAAEYGERLDKAVRMRLVGEVPVGTSLSGGLDSSSVAALIAKNLEKDASDKDLESVGSRQNTFSAVFPNLSNDEEEYVDALINKYPNKIKSHKIKPTPEDFLKDLQDFVRTQEEPIISTGPYAQYAVMREASKHVTVLLDGQGADEMMAGYNPYYYVYLNQLKSRKQYGALMAETTKSSDIVKKILRGKRQKVKPVTNLMQPEFAEKYSDEKMVVINNNLKMRLLDDIFKHSLPSLLRYEDRNTMRFSLEGRVPFIDKELLKYLFSLDDDAIIHGGWNKNILRDSMKGILPEKIRARRNKIGFTTPEGEWFKTIHKDLEKILASDEFAHRKYFNQLEVLREFKLDEKGKGSYGSMAFWRIINVELWLREFFDEKPDENAPKPEELGYAPNDGKKAEIKSDVNNKVYTRYMLRTELVTPETVLDDYINRYVGAFAKTMNKEVGKRKWQLYISEKIIATMQGRSYFLWDVDARWSARVLSRFVHRTPAGIGLGNPATMELALREAGTPRILLATVASAAGKAVGKRGVFYNVAGANVRAIDGPTSYSAYPANVSAKLPPKDPDVVAEHIAVLIRENEKIAKSLRDNFEGVVVIDSNDIGRNILGKACSDEDALLASKFADNPFGQARQLTPMAIVVEND